jgi:four helix bundle protein
MDARRSYDLEDRLVALGVLVARVADRLAPGRIAAHVSGQLVRCATSPAANYAEARSAESRKDFIHKLKVCLKELRETHVWLKYLNGLGMGKAGPLREALQETDELIAIFVVSIATARRNSPSDK